MGRRALPASQDAASARAALPAEWGTRLLFLGLLHLGWCLFVKNEVFPECTFVQGHRSMEVTTIWLLDVSLFLHPFIKYPVSPLGQTLSQM